MTALAVVSSHATLPDLIDRAVKALANARTAAEILEARDLASVVYDVAKKTARLGKVKQAHDSLIASAHRAQANALEIEAGAKRRLADEYDAAQERGEIRTQRDNQAFSKAEKASGPEIVPPKDLHEARAIRDAEQADPGIVRRTLDEAIDAGEEPTRAKVKRAVKGLQGKRAVKVKSKRTRQRRRDHNSPTESQHDRDLRMLLGVWESACASAREEFLETVTK